MTSFAHQRFFKIRNSPFEKLKSVPICSEFHIKLYLMFYLEVNLLSRKRFSGYVIPLRVEMAL